MDPDETLRKLRDAINAVHDTLNGEAPDEVDELIDGDPLERAASDLAEAAGDLDEWLSKGGFLPGDWAISRFVRDVKGS